MPVDDSSPSGCVFCDDFELGSTCLWSAEDPPANCSEAPAVPEVLRRSQRYEFDVYGNIQKIWTDGALRETPTSKATNRLDAPAAGYDARGNLTSWSLTSFAYDALNRMVRREVSGEPQYHFLYTADDERILWVAAPPGGGGLQFHWTLRDFGGKVLREYVNTPTALAPAHDYIFRGDQPLGEVDFTTPTPTTYHLTLDHLGTPRLKTNTSGGVVQKWKYFPFGEEAVPSTQAGTALRFTSHERDRFNLAGAADDIDYMHARLGVPLVGRFASVDAEQGEPEEPQSLNRYSYALASPLTMIDRNGRDPERFSGMMRQFVENSSLLQGHQEAGRNATIGIAGLGLVGAGGAAFAEARLAAALGQAFAAYGTARGNLIEGILASRFGGALPRVFPTIDRFLNGVATSVKSLDLTSRSYQDIGRLSSTIQSFVTKLAEFQGATVGRFAVNADSITSRVLELVVQASKMSPEQAAVIEKLVESAQEQGVTVKLIQAR